MRVLGGTVEDVTILGVRATTGGADDERLVGVAAHNGVAKVEASAALGEDRVGVKALYLHKAAKQGGGATTQNIEADSIGVMEAIDNTAVGLISEGGRGAKPSWGHEGAVARAGSVLSEFHSDDV